MRTLFRLCGRGEERVGKFLGFEQALRQRDAMHCTTLFVLGPRRTWKKLVTRVVACILLDLLSAHL
jgi:hypothetical protein